MAYTKILPDVLQKTQKEFETKAKMSMAVKVSDAARDLEMAVKNGNPDVVEPLLKAFEAALGEVTDMAGQIGSTAE